MAEYPPLDRRSLDAMLQAKPEMLWGLEEIARALSVNAKTARRWADDGKAPITKPAGRYFARRSELNAWLGGKR